MDRMGVSMISTTHQYFEVHQGRLEWPNWYGSGACNFLDGAFATPQPDSGKVGLCGLVMDHSYCAYIEQYKVTTFKKNT